MTAVEIDSRLPLADRLLDRTRAGDALLIGAGAIAVALLAQVSIPVGVVPITGQTLGVLLVGAILGSSRGAASLMVYLGAGLAGAPVFAGHSGGIGYAAMPSFGYLLGFIPAAWAIGKLSERMWDRRPGLALAAFALASSIPFLFGVPYLGVVLGASGQDVDTSLLLATGVLPFILPGIVKMLVAALLLPYLHRKIDILRGC